MLETFVTPKAKSLKGTIAIANAKMAYQHYKEYFQSERWQRLAEKGARVQRVLYGSTGTKNPAYSDVMYVENLIGPNTVNTIPPKTLEEFIDHGTVALTLESGLEEAQSQLTACLSWALTSDDVTQELLDEGVENFVKPYDALIRGAHGEESLIDHDLMFSCHSERSEESLPPRARLFGRGSLS